MLRLKTLSILESKEALSVLPEGKLLINTINAHSYNTALKDKAFAEALMKGDVLIPDGASIVKACRWLKAKSRPEERIGFVRVRNEQTEQQGWKMLLHGKQPESAEPDKRKGRCGLSQHHGGNVFSSLQAGVQQGG